MIQFGSLFAGIGGFDLGFERAGMECAWQVEIDERCREVLAYHWPDVDRSVVDVREARRGRLPAVEVICGGFPCQDVSIAGQRAGLDGERSGLWFEFLRVVQELEPIWVVVENVTGLLSSNGGRDFACVLRGLAECGYVGAYRVFDAQYFGVAQRRRRVFVVGHLGDWSSAAEVLFEREGSPWSVAPSRETGERVAALTKSGVGTCGADDNQALAGHLIAYQCQGSNVGPMGTIRGGNGGMTGGVPFVAQSVAVRRRDGGAMAGLVRRLTPRECERLQGFPDGWTAVGGMSDSARYRMLGNAVAVPVAEWIGWRIVKRET